MLIECHLANAVLKR